MWHVYILRCADQTLYTGISNNVKKRIEAHNSKRGAKYTKTRTPVKLVYKEKQPSHGDALKREVRIKRLSKKLKEQLASGIKPKRKKVKKKKKAKKKKSHGKSRTRRTHPRK